MEKDIKKVRFGVIGTNFITTWVLAGAREDPRFELAAVCSRDAARGREFAGRHSLPGERVEVFTDVDTMAAWPGIDAVYVASPNFMHASQAIACMNRGKHVLCEKPIAMNAAETKAMIDAAGRNGVALMEAMKPTLTPHFANLRANLHRIGKVRRYVANYCQYSSRYDRFKRGELTNAFDPSAGGGAVTDIGVYCLYPMVALFGRPDSVSAASVMLPGGVDGEGVATMTYGNDMIATVMYSKITDSRLHTEIQGEDGIISADSVNRMASQTFESRGVNTGGGAGSAAAAADISVQADHDEYYYEVAEFIDLILSGRRQSGINSLDTSLAVMEIVDEIHRQCGYGVK